MAAIFVRLEQCQIEIKKFAVDNEMWRILEKDQLDKHVKGGN